MKISNVINTILLTVLLGVSILNAKEKSPSQAMADLDTSTVPKSMLHSHSFGVGLGETFLAGDFEEHGDNKITTDFLYSYSASYSFDFLINAHYSEHSFKKKMIQLSGLNFGIKAKLYQFD